MNLSQKAIQSFQEVWMNRYGTQVSDEDADQLGTELLQFMTSICRPVPKKDFLILQNLRGVSISNIR